MIKFLGIILLCLLLYKVGWRETIDSIKKTPLIYLVISLFAFWIAFYLKSLRWKIVSNSYGIPLKGSQAFKVFFIGIFLANITPGKLGDFGRLFYIKDQIPNPKIGWSSLIMDRVFDLICLLFFSVIALFYYQLNFDIIKWNDNYWSLGIWVAVLIFGILLFVLLRKKIKKIVIPWWEVFNSHNLKTGSFWIAIVLTTLSVILIYGVFNYLAWGMNIPINHIGLFLGTFVLGVLTLLPITILGIGVRETSLVVIFQMYDLPSQDAIALSLIVFLLQIISFVPGAIWFYLSPIDLNQLKNLK
ncbi:lysylphosphatidylglycerol synthase transmembrane domain-containing protein [Aquimarina muelleri]|uniref:Lysylphosphatidylglycerol synthase TM region n=1 Tax=Aquimarina muelleri TaxID=279356 RepID=A0A918N3P6_9FLAO|nr:lysylphosphatidylglycerol synthase transmembrane domain-containing protein [Aquimarina muelleri]MCX2764567.1 flippase-like domain-containing protein [Aquimarina muelleri]GGX21593.1 hypothetical protein GCM10007384_23560 [Aquimarina muelleri]